MDQIVTFIPLLMTLCWSLLGAVFELNPFSWLIGPSYQASKPKHQSEPLSLALIKDGYGSVRMVARVTLKIGTALDEPGTIKLTLYLSYCTPSSINQSNQAPNQNDYTNYLLSKAPLRSLHPSDYNKQSRTHQPCRKSQPNSLESPTAVKTKGNPKHKPYGIVPS